MKKLSNGSLETKSSRFLFKYRSTPQSMTEVWLPGIIVQARGLVSYTVNLEDGRVVRCHIDHLQGGELPDGTQSIL